MPENIECANCGARVLGRSSGKPEPIVADDCHECGGTEFSRIRERDEGGDTTG